MKIIVGLGNPGKKYLTTRHNVGFLTLDLLASYYQVKFKYEPKFQAEIASMMTNTNEKIIFVKPQTFMNLSGIAVSLVMKFYQVDLSDLIVISDDAALTLGTIRLRAFGSHGGQNGLRSIIDSLKSNEFKRLKIGIGSSTTKTLSDHVLSSFSKDEQITIGGAIDKAKNAMVDLIADLPFSKIMTTYNTKEENSIK